MAQPGTSKKCVNNGDWSELHKDLLELILQRLRRAGDIIRFGAVCKPWRSVVVEARNQVIKPLSPLLLLPCNDNSRGYELFDFSKNKAYKIQVPEVDGTWFVNSSNEWLVTIKCTPPYEIHLLNPFTRVQIQLPPATAFQDPPPAITATPIEAFLHKVVASSTPLDPNCIVMAIYSNWKKLAFCKLGDTEWKTLESEVNCYKDIIYRKDNFYALGKLENIVLCDMGPDPKIIEVVPPVIPCWYYERKYLVESSSGDLLKILRSLDWEDTPEDESSRYKTIMFQVSKLDFSKGKWEVINSLGENSLFVGYNVSMLISVEEFPEFREDCIYFTDDYQEGYFENICGCHDMGVFSLKTRQFEPMFPFSQIWSSPLFGLHQICLL